MKTAIIGLFLICVLFGCSSNDKEFESIEFMSYTYSIYKENSNEPTNPYIKCRIYSIIDESGKMKIYTKRNYPKKVILYYTSSIDKSLVRKVIEASKIIETENKKKTFNPDKVMIYDGPSLKIRISYKNKTCKSFGFIDDENKDNYYFLRLYHTIDSTFLSNQLTYIVDTLDFFKKRIDFIKFTFIDDTTNSPFILPPPHAEPSNRVIYKIPENKK